MRIKTIIRERRTGRKLLEWPGTLEGADLRKIDFSNADLRGRSFFGSDLSGANLERADLTGADLRYTKLDGARMYKAVVKGAIWDSAVAEADLEGSWLERNHWMYSGSVTAMQGGAWGMSR